MNKVVLLRRMSVTMFWNLFITEQKKTIKRATLWVGTGLLSSLVLLSMIAMAGANPPADIVQRQIVWPMVLVLYLRQFAANSLITGLIVVVLAGAVVAQEYTWRTLNLLLSRGVSRGRFLAAKFGALLLPIVLVVLVPMIVGTVVSGYYTLQINGSLDFSPVNFPNLGISILLGAYALLPYAALAVMLAILGRSTVLAIGGGVGFLIAEMIVWQLLSALGETGKAIAQWFPMSLSMGVLKWSQAIANVVPPGNAGLEYWNTFQLHPVGLSAVLVAVYTGVLLLVSYLGLRRQDLT